MYPNDCPQSEVVTSYAHITGLIMMPSATELVHLIGVERRVEQKGASQLMKSTEIDMARTEMKTPWFTHIVGFDVVGVTTKTIGSFSEPSHGSRDVNSIKLSNVIFVSRVTSHSALYSRQFTAAVGFSREVLRSNGRQQAPVNFLFLLSQTRGLSCFSGSASTRPSPCDSIISFLGKFAAISFSAKI